MEHGQSAGEDIVVIKVLDFVAAVGIVDVIVDLLGQCLCCGEVRCHVFGKLRVDCYDVAVAELL